MKILLVDDEPQYRVLLRSILQEDGHEVLDASDGREAYVKLGRVAVDLVISDVYMPEMDGIKLHAKVRETPGMEGLPFLFVSAYDDPHTQGAVKDPRRDGFFRKGRPVSLLREWVKFLLTPYSRRTGPPPGEGRTRRLDDRKDRTSTA